MPPKRHHEEDEEINTSNKRQRVIPNSNTRSQQLYEAIDSVIGIWTESRVLPPLIDIIRSYTIPPTRWACLVDDGYQTQSLAFYDPQNHQQSESTGNLTASGSWLSTLSFSHVTGQLYYVKPIGGFQCKIYTIDEHRNEHLICENLPFYSGTKQIWTPCMVYCDTMCLDLVSKACLPHNISDDRPLRDVTMSIAMGDYSFVAFTWHYNNGGRCFYWNGANVQSLANHTVTNNDIVLLIDNKLISCHRYLGTLTFWSLSFTKLSNGDLVFADEWIHITETSYSHVGADVVIRRIGMAKLLLYSTKDHPRNDDNAHKYHLLEVQPSGAVTWTRHDMPEMIKKSIDITVCEVEINASFYGEYKDPDLDSDPTNKPLARITSDDVNAPLES